MFHISRERLTEMLRSAYELGCRGWMELADSTAESLVEQCIADLSSIRPSTLDPKEIRKTIGDVRSNKSTLGQCEFAELRSPT